jgi:nitrate reductase delta subunit
MQTLKVLAVLLHYPGEEAQAAAPELRDLLATDPLLEEAERRGLAAFVARMQSADLLDLQAEYVATFDRGRKLSLHLFEHVHGESRDRGQAMVDLLARYRAIGLDLAVKELPDYLPLFLEYCSLLPEDRGREQLGEVGHLLQLLHARLERRASPYATLFMPLLRLAGVGRETEALRERVAAEDRDDTPQALDRDWEETAITFGPESESCPSAGPRHHSTPVQWVSRRGTAGNLPGSSLSDA